jgi:hypothetical protein
MSRLSEQQIAQGWINQGGPSKYADLMAKIALRESGGRSGINNRGLNKNGTVDWGLFQVNDIWRKDPSSGRCSGPARSSRRQARRRPPSTSSRCRGRRRGRRTTPRPTTKYLGAFNSSAQPTATPRPRSAPSTTTRTVATTPGVDNSALRRQLVGDFLQQGGVKNSNATLSFASGIQAAQDTPGTRTVQRSSAPSAPAKPRAARPTAPHPGLAHFDGKLVAGWIEPILQRARATGLWKGSVSSGYRSDAEQTAIYKSGVRPAALPRSMGGGGSNHEGATFPYGAVDVSDAAGLAAALRKLGVTRLQYAGGKDPVHFSHPHDGGY